MLKSRISQTMTGTGIKSEMKSVLNKQRPDLPITDDSVKDFIDYFKKNPDDFTETVNQLKQDINSLHKNPEFVSKGAPISLVNEGKKWLIFNNYVIDTLPYFIDVTASQTPTDVEIN